jgi:5-hydroxyisourate hydrolase-like protein (transthyretin family)
MLDLPPLFRVEPELPRRSTSGPDGKFAFRDVAPGTYRIYAHAPGFAMTYLGQRVANGIGRAILVTAGLSLKDAAIRMTPASVVTGRVLDENSQPATGAPVQLLRREYSVQQVSHSVVATGVADDRGVYRIYDVAPGRYYLVAGTAPGPSRQQDNDAAGSASADRYLFVYYPDAEPVERAGAIDVKAGTEAAVNMRVRRQTRLFRVTGRVVNTTALPLPPTPNILLAHRAPVGSGQFGVNRKFDPATGVFELQDVPPGDYAVQLHIPEPAPTPPATLQDPRPRDAFARVQIRVVDKDVEGVVLTVSTGATASGRLIVEGQPLPTLPPNQSPRLGFLSADLPLNRNAAPTGGFVAPDGTFQVIGLRDGEYRVIVVAADTLLNAGYYVKSIRYGEEEISSKLFKFSGSGSGVFELRLAQGLGQVSGTLTDAASQPVPGVQVSLVPSDPDRMHLSKDATTDETGRFTIAGVAPGEYKAFSWEALESNAFFNPAVLQQYATEGKPVRVTASSTSTVDLQLILAP